MRVKSLEVSSTVSQWVDYHKSFKEYSTIDYQGVAGLAQITENEITVSTFIETEKTVNIELPKKLVEKADDLGVDVPEVIERYFLGLKRLFP